MIVEAVGVVMVLVVTEGAVRWVVHFLIWASLPGFEEAQRKTAPDTEPETHLTMLVECPPGARAEVDPHSMHCEYPLPTECRMQRLWGQVCSADARAG